MIHDINVILEKILAFHLESIDLSFIKRRYIKVAKILIEIILTFLAKT